MVSKEYLQTARTLLRMSKDMTDQTIASRLMAPLPVITRAEPRWPILRKRQKRWLPPLAALKRRPEQRSPVELILVKLSAGSSACC